MRRFRNILVGVDGSEQGFHALEEAIGLAQWGRGGVTVIHVALSYEGDLSLVGVRNIKAAVHGPGEQILGKAVEIAESHNVSIRTIYDEGKAHEKIAHHGMMRDVDLIVLGARRTPSIAGLVFGNVLTRVIELCPGDVLAIPDQASIGWEKILFAFESSKCIKDRAARVMELAVIYGGELKTLSVMNSFFDSNGKVPPDKECLMNRSALECLENLQAQAEQAGVKNEGVLLSGRFHKVVGKFARQERVNIIIVGSNGSRPKWGFVRSPIAGISSSAPCPMLFLRHR